MAQSTSVSGTFAQSGGTDSVGSLIVGSEGINGFCSVSGNSLLSAKGIKVGADGEPGNMTQSGGTVAVTGSLTIGGNDFAVYDLNGGDLLIASLVVTNGSGEFNFSGGTIQARHILLSSASLWLDNPSGNATINPAGYTVTLSGSLAGSGNLIESSTGKLILSATNSYSGGTTVSGGELVIMDSRDCSAVPTSSSATRRPRARRGRQRAAGRFAGFARSRTRHAGACRRRQQLRCIVSPAENAAAGLAPAEAFAI